MPQIIRLNLPLQVVPRMHHLMRHGILLMPSVPELVRAQQDSVVQTEASRLFARAHPTQDIVLVQIATQLVHLIGQEPDDGRVLQQVFLVRFAALAYRLGFGRVQLGEVALLQLDVSAAGHATQHDGEGVAPVVVYRIQLRRRWARLRDGGGMGPIGGLFGLGHGGAFRIVGLPQKVESPFDS